MKLTAKRMEKTIDWSSRIVVAQSVLPLCSIEKRISSAMPRPFSIHVKSVKKKEAVSCSRETTTVDC